MSPWKGSKEDVKQGHHLLPKKNQNEALGRAYDDKMVRVSPEDYQQMHRDIKEGGPIYGVSKQDKHELERRHKKPFWLPPILH